MKDSIRIRITFYYSIAIILILIIFSYFVYKKIENVLYENVDETLFLKAEGVYDGIASFVSEFDSKYSNLSLSDKRVSSFINDIINSDITNPSFSLISIAILDFNGNFLYSSLNFPSSFKSFVKLPDEIRRGKDVFKNVFSDSDELARAYFTSMKVNNKTYIIVALKSLNNIHFTLSIIRRNIMFAIPITVFLTAFIGAFMVKMTLKPVEDIIKTVKQIKDKNLNLRINLPKSRDEIYELVKTFNDMLVRLENAFLNQKELIGDLSHQIKTPLTVIKGEIELALKKTRTVDEYQKTLKSILEETEKIKDLVENLLMIAKLESFENKFEPKNKVGIVDSFKKAIELLEKYAVLKNINIKIEENFNRDVLVFFDEYILVRAFYNIIENSIKYSNSFSEVIVRIYEDSVSLLIEVEDFGPGIDENDLENIFKRFYRGKNVLDKEGFGLGLYLSKSAINRIGGKIDILRKSNGVIFKLIFKKD